MRLQTVLYIIRRYNLSLSIQVGAASMLAFWLGLKLSVGFHDLQMSAIGGLWTAISAAVVLDVKERDAFFAVWIRFFSTAVGVAIAGAIVSGLGYSIAALFLSAVLIVMVCALCNFKEAFKQAIIGALVVFAVGSTEPHLSVWWNCLLRFVESVVGIGVGVIFVFLFYPFRCWFRKNYDDASAAK